MDELVQNIRRKLQTGRKNPQKTSILTKSPAENVRYLYKLDLVRRGFESQISVENSSEMDAKELESRAVEWIETTPKKMEPGKIVCIKGFRATVIPSLCEVGGHTRLR